MLVVGLSEDQPKWHHGTVKDHVRILPVACLISSLSGALADELVYDLCRDGQAACQGATRAIERDPVPAKLVQIV